MPIDYGEKEREFLSELKADTGRDLAQWMTAISAEGFRDKNEVIDWLRGQGFMFWKASWLERVHHNGGRPIYADAATARANAEFARNLLEPAGARPSLAAEVVAPPAAAAIATPGAGAVASAAARPAPVAMPAASIAAASPIAPAISAQPAELAQLLARAKGYRPLAEHLLRTLRAAVHGAEIVAQGAFVVARSGGEAFAAVAPGPREIRLGLALGGRPSTPLAQRGRLAGAPERITHVVALTDARQVTPELQGLIREAGAAGRD